MAESSSVVEVWLDGFRTLPVSEDPVPEVVPLPLTSPLLDPDGGVVPVESLMPPDVPPEGLVVLPDRSYAPVPELPVPLELPDPLVPVPP
jgi:hypothetical protein